MLQIKIDLDNKTCTQRVQNTYATLNYRQLNKPRHLVTERGEFLRDLRVGLLSLRSSNLLLESKFLGVVSGTLGLSALLKSSNNVLVLPSDLVAETADSCVLAARLEAEDTESLGNDNALLLVVGGGDTLKDLQTGKGSLTTSGLVGDHTTDGLVEDPAGGTEVEGTVGAVETSGLAEVSVVLQLVAEELTANVKLLSTDNSHALAVEDLLRNNGRKTTQKMAFGVDDNLLFKGAHS